MPHILISMCFPVRKLNSLVADNSWIIRSDGHYVWHIHFLYIRAASLGSTLGTSVFSQHRLYLYILPDDYEIHLPAVKSGFHESSGVNCYWKKKICGRESLPWLMIWFIAITENYPPWLFKLLSVGLSQIKCQAVTSTGEVIK